jgi:hypothetical protein
MEMEHEHRTRVMAQQAQQIHQVHQARHLESMRASLMNAANGGVTPGTRTPSPGAAAFHNPNLAAFQANHTIPMPDDGSGREEAERARLARQAGIEQQLRYINQVHQQMQQRSSSQPPLRNPASAPPTSTTPPSGTPHIGSTGNNPSISTDGAPDPPRRASGSDSSSGGREIPALQNLTSRLEHTEREINTLRDLLSNINAGSNTGFPAGALPMQRLAALQQYEALRNHTRTLVVILDQISNILRNLTVPDAATRTPHTVEQASELRSSTDRLRNEVRQLENRVNALIFTATANSPAFNQVPRAPSPAGRIGSQFASRMASRAASPAPPLVRVPGMDLTATTSHFAQSYDTPAVYLLNSPQGPQALLMRDDQLTTQPSPTFQQNFAAPQPEISPQNEEILRMIEQLQGMVANQGRPASGPASPQAQNQQVPPNLPNDQAGANGQANPAQQPGLVVRPVPAGNGGIFQLIAAAIPHVWFVIRMAFFIYFFSAGLDWRRLIPMSLIGLGVWLIHIGLFDERWEGIRRHFEGLIMDDANPRANAPAGGARQHGDGAGDREPRPEDTAARLLAAREASNVGWLRERTRTMERAVAMFVASLWPGVGERHLRARDEARQRAEEAAAAAEAANAEQPTDQPDAGEGAAGQARDDDDVSAMFTPVPSSGQTHHSASATEPSLAAERAEGASRSIEVAGGTEGLHSRRARDEEDET